MKYLISILAFWLPLLASEELPQSPGDLLRQQGVTFDRYRFIGQDTSNQARFAKQSTGKAGPRDFTRPMGPNSSYENQASYVLVLNPSGTDLVRFPVLEEGLFNDDQTMSALLNHLQNPGDMTQYHAPIVAALDSGNPQVVNLALLELVMGPRDRQAQTWVQKLTTMWDGLDSTGKGIMIRLTNRYGKLLPGTTLAQARALLDGGGPYSATALEDAFEVLGFKGSAPADFDRIKNWMGHANVFLSNTAIHYGTMLDEAATLARVNSYLAGTPSAGFKARLERWKRIHDP